MSFRTLRSCVRKLYVEGGTKIVKFISGLLVLTTAAVLIASAVSAAGAFPACEKLLTLQDVTKAAGPGFKAPTKEAAAVLGPGCFYHRTTEQGGSYIEDDIHLTFKEYPGGAAAKLLEVSSTYKLGGALVVAASGLGANSFYLEDKDAGRTIVFFGKGNLLLQLTHKVGKQTDPKTALALAKLVYSRL